MNSKTLQLKRVLRAPLFILLLAVGMTNAMAQTFDDGVLNYEINDDGVSVTVKSLVNPAATNSLTIPETTTYNGVTYKVTGIATRAFMNHSGLTGDLVIPNSVTTIGTMAFLNCTGFTGHLTLGNSVTYIGGMAFACQNGANYTGNLVLPNSVTVIESRAFMNCSGFTGNLTVPSSVTTLIAPFSGCSGFTSFTMLPDIPTGSSLGIEDYNIPITVSCGSKSLYQYAPNWRYYTNISEDCSGMFEVSAKADPVEGGSIIFGTGGETLFSDSFEKYTSGNAIAAEALASGNDWWNTWDNTPGGEKDGIVTEYHGRQCGHLVYGNDQVLLLGNKESGAYEIEFDMLIPDGKNGFFSLLHQFSDGSADQAVTCHLHVKDGYPPEMTPGSGTIERNNGVLAYIPCIFDAWMHFRINIDIDNDVARFYFSTPGNEELFLCQWQWSLGDNNADEDGTLAAMDFWPPMNEETSEFYIDNVRFIKYNREFSMGNNVNLQLVSENAFNERGAAQVSRYFAPGSTCTLTAMANEGYRFLNWTKGGIPVSTDATYTFTVTEAKDYVANFEQTGVDEWGNCISVFPNPVACGENISLCIADEFGSKVCVEIINAVGMVVDTRIISSLQSAPLLKAPDTAGIYTVRVIGEDKGTYCRKLIVR